MVIIAETERECKRFRHIVAGSAMSSRAPRDTAAFEVHEALRHAGCVVCHLALRSVKRQVRAIAYEQVNDVDLRAQLRRARGFCNTHAYLWLREAHNVLGTALIYRDVLRWSLEELDSGAAPTERRGGGLLQGLLGATGPGGREVACPACMAQHDAEARYTSALVGLLAGDAGARAAFEASDGLCRVHTWAAARIGGPGAEAVMANARMKVEALVAALDEVIRKEDYRFRHEERSPAERSAPQRAVNWASGIEGLTSR